MTHYRLNAEALYHTKSDLLCLVCRHVVSFLFAPRLYFSLHQNMMCCMKAPWLVGRSNSNEGGQVFAKGELWVNISQFWEQQQKCQYWISCNSVMSEFKSHSYEKKLAFGYVIWILTISFGCFQMMLLTCHWLLVLVLKHHAIIFHLKIIYFI